MLITFCLLATLLAIAVTDVRHRRIPDMLSLPLIAAGLALAAGQVWLGAPSQVLNDRVIGAAVGYLIFAAIGSAFFRLRGTEGLGLGDAKLLAAAGAWLGWQMLPALVLIAAVGGLAQVGVQALRSRNPDGTLAFGPWLALGFSVLWVFAT
ncbi:prepilin peptidase [Paracoccus liaowanqingii]|uniref:Prepilin peptidase n=1 Tax=Paracoccus liaowanqingii TaxID=2560053 RepID=A0A4Z1CR15_9RHOB|nr:A24 family peptidase [Paracoccus liaowanqingii]QDA36467.1 prepilin peptidase [Paracoccus liaowanqingii]TGN67543.1 prepilin peptidase [Paracoccus liaowanqingii]